MRDYGGTINVRVQAHYPRRGRGGLGPIASPAEDWVLLRVLLVARWATLMSLRY